MIILIFTSHIQENFLLFQFLFQPFSHFTPSLYLKILARIIYTWGPPLSVFSFSWTRSIQACSLIIGQKIVIAKFTNNLTKLNPTFFFLSLHCKLTHQKHLTHLSHFLPTNTFFTWFSGETAYSPVHLSSVSFAGSYNLSYLLNFKTELILWAAFFFLFTFNSLVISSSFFVFKYHL